MQKIIKNAPSIQQNRAVQRIRKNKNRAETVVTMQFEIGENRTRGFGCVVDI